MKAVRIYGPQNFKIEDVPINEPKAGEALVKVKAVGFCGTDYELYTNEMVYIKTGRAKLPVTPGHEFSGIIERVGEGVTAFKPGDKVTGECTIGDMTCKLCQKGFSNQCEGRVESGIMNKDGAFAEYVTFPATHLHKFDNLSFEEAALIEPTAVGMYTLLQGNAGPMDNVLVSGPGPVGLQVAQMAKKLFGCKRVIISGTRVERLERAKKYDLDGYINIRTENFKDRITELTNGEMIDLVMEESGGANVFEDIAKVINPCGRVVLNGFFGKKNALIDWDAFTTKNIHIIGTLGSPNIWDEVIYYVQTGKIETKNLISHVFSGLDNFEKGLDIMSNRKENACKVVINP
jgi:threonine dehydrogenase-like Zn-dependent dehydrogenase